MSTLGRFSKLVLNPRPMLSAAIVQKDLLQRQSNHFGRFGTMPALDNPRWERFAQALVEGLTNGDGKPYSQGRAYNAAGYYAKDAGKSGGSAEAAASRLLKKVKPILERVRELQAIAATKAAETPEKLAGELNRVLAAASEDKAHSAAVSAILGKAKVLGLEPPSRTELGKPGDFSQCQSLEDIGRKLLQQVDYAEPSDDAIEQAIAANQQFIETLEAIRDKALGSNVEHGLRDIESSRDGRPAPRLGQAVGGLLSADAL